MDQDDLIIRFVSLQRALIAAYKHLVPELGATRWLENLPRMSELTLGEERWEATKHGAGLQFTRRQPAPHLVVDAHEEPSNSERIDAWRLQQFSESLGMPVEFGACEAAIRAAVETRILVSSSPGAYRLRVSRDL
jgi:hypothetical protein